MGPQFDRWRKNTKESLIQARGRDDTASGNDGRRRREQYGTFVSRDREASALQKALATKSTRNSNDRQRLDNSFSQASRSSRPVPAHPESKSLEPSDDGDKESLLVSKDKRSSIDRVEQPSTDGAQPNTPKRGFHPESPTTPLWRKLLFQYFDDFLGSAEGIRSSDSWELESKYKSAVVSKELRELYSSTTNQTKKSGSGKDLARTIVAMEWRGFVASGLLSLAYVIINASIPLTLFSLLTQVMESTSYDLVTIYVHLVALYLLQLLARAVMFLGYFQGTQMEYHVISALRALIFETAISVPHEQVEDKSELGFLSSTCSSKSVWA